jgi:hypothetical protein
MRPDGADNGPNGRQLFNKRCLQRSPNLFGICGTTRWLPEIIREPYHGLDIE